ncbi:hypothetical protein CRG98_026936 [Punica granatum]|uniref:Uncharacterized protein n=1 Tax=Punica granatum TaxID=22663 RepID=A0A2I0JAI2_PUNGR|nr:hypothetical protein CRG98_026936 [Punica granatum]
MKERVERFVVLPFAVGCTSESSVAVGSSSSLQSSTKKPKSESRPYAETTRQQRGERGLSGDHYHHQKPRSSLPNFFYGVQKLIAGSFKSFSQIFVQEFEIY